jgi:hypothetical protein
MNAVAVLLNRGDGRLLDPAVYQAGDGPAALVVEDIDLDGELDLAVPNFYSANLSILLGNGDGTFRDALNFPAGQTAWRILAKDLDADGVVDLAVKTDGVAVFLNRTTPPASYDEDRDGIPDECDRTPFHRGDPNGSGTTDISDAITTFGYLFLAVPVALSCKESADSNSDAAVDISDGVYLLSWLFTGGPVPATPGPTETPCGFDPDPAGSAGDLGCGVYVPCQ